MLTHSSAGVYASEQDLSQRIAGASTSIGVVVGHARKGPIGQRTLITNTQDFQKIFGTPDPTLTFMHYAAIAFLTRANQLYVTRVAVNALYGGYKLTTVNGFCTATAFVEGYADTDDIAFVPDDILAFYGRDQGKWNNNIRVVAFPDTDDLDNEAFIVQVYEGTSTQASETHRGTLRYKVDGLGKQLQIEEVINNKSNLIRVKLNPLNTTIQNQSATRLVNAVVTGNFTNGSDGTTATNTDIMNAWELYADPEELDVNLLINAGYTDTAVQLKMTEIAERRDDCFAILDMPSDLQEVQDAVNYRRNTLNLNSSYAAMYTPDLYVEDQTNGIKLYVPPSGHVAAAYARTDDEAAVWFAPAGLVRGRLNVLGVKEVYDQGMRNALDKSQINVIRNIPGEGTVIYGADTLYAVPSLLTNIHVRRLVNYVKKGAILGSMFGVFEPNDDILANRLIAIQRRFLKPIKNGRGLLEFEVLDQTTDADRDNGDRVIGVYLTPVPYAKRIFINTIVNRSNGIEFEVGLAA